MKYFGQICALVLVLAVSFTLVGCGGGKKASKASQPAASNVKLSEAQTYDYGVTFAAPEGWEAASRQSKTIVMFKNPNRDGQSVYIKVPENAQIKTLATKEDAEKAGLKGNLIQVGDYAWMSKTQKSVDPKTEDEFESLICTTIQFGKVYTVQVRGFQNQNDNSEGIMNAVLSKIKFSEATEAPKENIEEIQDFGEGFSL
ncbi:MAG: hypothetical protein K6C40_14970 [Thermoguttaceae bacterium]|nr:hypothetical protein [Thermoguttaceae bacterium]